jgi:glycosyltransferase involved in cell wall biosynthesis
MLQENSVDFRLSVIGERGYHTPKKFAAAEKIFSEHIVNWGYVDSRDEYLKILADADIIVSTAVHEFFGISVVEAIAAGAYPLLPRRLAYPEVLALPEHPERECFFYGENADELGAKLLEYYSTPGNLWAESPATPDELVSRYYWSKLAPQMAEQLLKTQA